MAITTTIPIGSTTGTGPFSTTGVRVNDGSATGGIIWNGEDKGLVSSTATSYMLFKGITIPQNSTINSAYLNINTTITGGWDAENYVDIQIDTDKSISAITNVTQVNSPISTTHRNFSWWMKYHNGVTSALTSTPDETVKICGQSGTGVAAYNLTPHNLTTLVQNLVNSTNYSNDNMAVYVAGSGDTGKIYFSDWGAPKSPELKISYAEPPVLVDKTTYVFE